MTAIDRPLRVLHCMWRGDIGGAERAVYQLVREQLSDASIRPAILFGQPGGYYWDAVGELGCPRMSAGLGRGSALSGAVRAARLMRGYDVHHFHAAEPALMLASALCNGPRRVYTHRGAWVDHESTKQEFRYAVVGWLLRHRFHAISGNTAEAGSAAAKLFGLDAPRIAVTYNGIDFDLLRATRSRDEVRAELGVDAADYVLGTSAILKAGKRIDRLVDAVADADTERLRLLVVGDGPDRTSLEQLARRRRVDAHVTFVGMQNNVADFLQAMDAFALPSFLESFGNAAVEAMAFGLPTLVFADGGGIVEHIEPRRTGFVVTDQEDLVTTLVHLVKDPGAGRVIGAAGREYVRSRYTPARAADAYAELYAMANAPTGRVGINLEVPV